MSDKDDSGRRIQQIRQNPADADTDDIEYLLSALASDDIHRRRSASLALTGISAEDPAALTGQASALGAAVEDAPQVRGQVTQALADVAVAEPERVVPVADDLRNCLGIDADVTEQSAIRALTAIAEVDTAVIVELAPALRSVVSNGSNLEGSIVQTLALLGKILPEAPDEVIPIVPDLLTLLESVSVDSQAMDGVSSDLEALIEQDQQKVLIQQASARKVAAVLLARITAARPDAVLSHLDEISEFLDDPDIVVRKAVVDTLHSVGTTAPDALAESDLVYALVVRLQSDDEDEEIRGRIAAVLGAITIERPEATVAEAETVVPPAEELLNDEKVDVRAGATKLLASIAAVEPAAVSGAVPELRSSLADSDPLVRARALLALRDLQVTEAKPKIRAMAKNDPDSDVRALARETRDELSDTAD